MTSTDKSKFPHFNKYKLQVKASANSSLKDKRLTKTQLSEIIQSGVYLGGLVGPLMKFRLPLMKNVLIPLAKSVLVPLGLTGISGNLVVKSKLPPRSGSSLEAVEPHP